MHYLIKFVNWWEIGFGVAHLWLFLEERISKQNKFSKIAPPKLWLYSLTSYHHQKCFRSLYLAHEKHRSNNCMCSKSLKISCLPSKWESHPSQLKVEALWFGCYGVIIWFLSGKNESEWFLLFSLSDIFLRYSCTQFSVCVLRKFVITSLRSYGLG